MPDIGDFSDVEIIEMHVEVGDVLASEDPILTLESDKATMEVPSPVAGKVTELGVKVGDKISQDDYLITIETSTSDSTIDTQDSPTQPIESKETDQVHT